MRFSLFLMYSFGVFLGLTLFHFDNLYVERESQYCSDAGELI
jgi:hypothetical protein